MDCIFGIDCPVHGVNCRMCLALPTQMPFVNWNIQIDINGYPIFFVNDQNWRRYPICKQHFLDHFGLDEEDIENIQCERRLSRRGLIPKI